MWQGLGKTANTVADSCTPTVGLRHKLYTLSTLSVHEKDWSVKGVQFTLTEVQLC